MKQSSIQREDIVTLAKQPERLCRLYESLKCEKIEPFTTKNGQWHSYQFISQEDANLYLAFVQTLLDQDPSLKKASVREEPKGRFRFRITDLQHKNLVAAIKESSKAETKEEAVKYDPLFRLELEQDEAKTECIQQEEVDKTEYFFGKIIRGDNQYWRLSKYYIQFVTGLLLGVKFDLREPKRKLTTKASGQVLKRAEKKPQYTLDEKKLFPGQIQSTSVIIPKLKSRVFQIQNTDGKNVKQRAVGLWTHPEDTLHNRNFLFDIGTYTIPYDFDSDEHASQFNTKLYAEDQYIDAVKPVTHTQISESLRRMRLNPQKSKVLIASDNFESRMISQYLKWLLHKYWNMKQQQLNQPDSSIDLPIIFYDPGSGKTIVYKKENQRKDRDEATKIFNSLDARKKKIADGDFEFLLGLDKAHIIEAILMLLDDGEPLLIHLIRNGFIYIAHFLIMRDGTESYKKLVIGPYLTTEDALKQTALHYAAAHYGSPEILSWLITNGASPNAANKESHTPIQVAASAMK